MWGAQHLTTLSASTACYRDSFILLSYHRITQIYIYPNSGPHSVTSLATYGILTRSPNPILSEEYLLNSLLQAILNPSLHLLNVLLQLVNKLGLIKKKTLWYAHTHKNTGQYIQPQPRMIVHRPRHGCFAWGG
jgi:hypothetical protein